MNSNIDRKLLSVMFTDIVDFTEKMSIDEIESMNLLGEKLLISKSTIEKFNGIFVKNIGDGTLSYFQSAVDSIDCANEIISKLERRVQIRIGIHYGEVILKDKDIFGDTVNIASRIEQLSPEGGICVSSAVSKQLKNKKKYSIVHTGLHSFKGVGRLLDIYKINSNQKNFIMEPQSLVERPKQEKLPSISIIPLRNKGLKDDDFYAYSISQDIYSKISTTSNIVTASMEEIEDIYLKYNSRIVSKKLKTRYCLTGSLWKKQSKFNLSLELFDTKRNKIIWADSWLEEWANLSRIEAIISGNLITILDKESAKVNELEHMKLADSNAYRTYLKGKFIYNNRQSKNDIVIAEKLFKDSISKDKELIQPRMLIGEIHYQSGELESALDVFKNNLALSLDKNESKNISSSLASIGAIYYQKADYGKALEFNLQALKIRKKIKNIKGIAMSFNSLGAINDVLKKYDLALDYYKRAIVEWKKIDGESFMVPSIFNIANLYNTKGDFYRAMKAVKKTIHLSRKTKNKTFLGYSYNLLGAILSNEKRFDDSLVYLKKALKIKRELNEPEGISSALKSIGHVNYRKSKFKEALIYYKKSLEVRVRIGNKSGIAKSYNYIGDTYRKIGENNKSIDSYKKSLSVFQSLEDYDESSKILNKMGSLYRKKGRYNKAFEFLKKSKEIKEEIKDHENLGYTLDEISMIHKWQGNYEKALKYNIESTKIAKEYNNKKLLANNYYHLSMLMIDKGNLIKSKKNINKAIKIAKKEQYMRNAAKYLDCLGIILRQERKFTDSIKVVNEALLISKLTNDQHGMRKYLNSIGLVEERKGNFNAALKIYIDCLEISRKIGERRSAAVSCNNAAGMYSALGDKKNAIKFYKKAFLIAKRINYKQGMAAYSFNIASSYYEQENLSKCLTFLLNSEALFKEMSDLFHNEVEIFLCYIYLKKEDIKNLNKFFKKIKSIDSNNNLSAARNWEIYQIRQAFNKSKTNEDFLIQAKDKLNKELLIMNSKKGKKMFIENFMHNANIVDEELQYN
mgnify:CR=1 FL=1